ncbi:MAG: response regulator transcription factor [Aristaeellaceae bacterium]
MPGYSYMRRARVAGLESFWYKEASILEVMRRTMAGESVYPDAPPELMPGQARSVDFTGHELKVLREMTGGCTNAEISQRLHISVSSVKAHMLSRMARTGFRNRTEPAVRARESGLVILDERGDG